MKTWKRYSAHRTRKSAEEMVRLLKETTNKLTLGYRIEKEESAWYLWIQVM